MSLKFRFTLAISAGFLLMAAAFAAIVHSQVKSRLFADAQAALATTLEHEWKYIDLEDHQPDPTSNHFENVYFMLTLDRKIVFSTFPERFPLHDLDKNRYLQQTQSQTRNGKQYELRGVLNLGPTQTYLATLRRALWLGCILTFIFALPLSYGCATLLLRPFSFLSRKASELTADRLSSLIPEPQHKDEYARLVRSFNSLLLRLDRSFALMRRFASNASHEFRTPIAIITAQTEMALRRTREPHEYQQILRKIDSQAKGLRTMSHMLLSLSEIEKMEEECPKPLNVKKALDDVIKSLTSRSSKHRKEVELILENFSFRTNEGLFLGIANNLVDNALKYSRSKVRISAQKVDGCVDIKIEDDGEGIPQTDIGHIGEPFFRSKRTHATEGYGLGLALVSAYARASRTTIAYDKSPMGGLSVRVKFTEATAS